MMDVADQRTIVLNDVALPYRLTRGRRRSVSIQVDVRGVAVRAPRWLALRDIEAVLIERRAWIFKTIDWWRNHTRTMVAPGWQEGAQVLYRGAPLTLSIRDGRPVLPQGDVAHDLFGLRVTLPANTGRFPEERAALAGQAVRRWWWQEAEQILLPQALEMAARLGRMPSLVRLSRATTLWGSCNARGALRLNWRLILVPPPLALDVIAHEVAHLRELNHSSRFQDVLEALRPGCRERQRALAEWAGLLAEN